MAHYVFLSHSIKDKTVADAIVARLEADSVTCWVAPRDVVPGADWGESIINAVESSRIMILIFSQSAHASSQIKREVERPVNKGVYIIPFRLDDIPPTRSLEYFISTSQWMDAFPPPLERHLHNLAKTVKAVLGAPLFPPSIPPPPATAGFAASDYCRDRSLTYPYYVRDGISATSEAGRLEQLRLRRVTPPTSGKWEQQGPNRCRLQHGFQKANLSTLNGVAGVTPVSMSQRVHRHEITRRDRSVQFPLLRRISQSDHRVQPR